MGGAGAALLGDDIGLHEGHQPLIPGADGLGVTMGRLEPGFAASPPFHRGAGQRAAEARGLEAGSPAPRAEAWTLSRRSRAVVGRPVCSPSLRDHVLPRVSREAVTQPGLELRAWDSWRSAPGSAHFPVVDGGESLCPGPSCGESKASWAEGWTRGRKPRPPASRTQRGGCSRAGLLSLSD